MTPPLTVDQHLKELLEHPRAFYVLLDMYEGLAQYCEQQAEKNAADSTDIDQYRRFYRDRVGIDFADRKKIKRQIKQLLAAESGS